MSPERSSWPQSTSPWIRIWNQMSRLSFKAWFLDQLQLVHCGKLVFVLLPWLAAYGEWESPRNPRKEALANWKHWLFEKGRNKMGKECRKGIWWVGVSGEAMTFLPISLSHYCLHIQQAYVNNSTCLLMLQNTNRGIISVSQKWLAGVSVGS